MLLVSVCAMDSQRSPVRMLKYLRFLTLDPSANHELGFPDETIPSSPSRQSTCRIAVKLEVSNNEDTNTNWGAGMSRADLTCSDLREANLQGADVSGACLFQASLCAADLRRVTFYGSNLSGADLTDARCPGTDFRKANLRWATMPDGTTRD